MRRTHGYAMGVALTALASTAGPSTAQTPEVKRQIEALQSEIRQQQQRLQQLQEQVDRLMQLPSQVEDAQRRASKAEEDLRAARAVPAAPAGPKMTMSPGNRPGIASADGRNTIELTSRLHFDVGDYLSFHPQSPFASAQDLGSGVNARRARIGVLGKFLDDWNYALIYDFGGSSDALPPTTGAPTSGIENAYISYTGFRPTTFDLGYIDAPFTLDEATSSNDIMFIERSSAEQVAANLVAGDFRSAAGVRRGTDRYWAGVYLTGPTSGTPHNIAAGTGGSAEQFGAFGRFTYQALQSSDVSLHLGVDAAGLLAPPHAGGVRTITLSDRPELRIDPTALLTATLAPVKNAAVYGIEAALGYKSLFLQGEYYRFLVNRDGLPSVNFSGGYAEASWTITGERRTYLPATGAYGGIVPDHPLSLSGGGFGAFEVAARYSEIDLNDRFTPGLSAAATQGVAGGRQMVYALGLNWYPNGNVRFMFDYLHGDVNRPNGVAPATASAAPLGVGLGGRFDAVALRSQVAF